MINHPNRSKTRIRRTAVTLPEHDHDADYAALLKGVRATFAVAASDGHLFCTEATGLFDRFLAALPQTDRTIHTCNTCRQFFKSYGGLVAINDAGAAVSAMWHPESVPSFYASAITSLQTATLKARVTAPFLSTAVTWGTPHTGDWTHLAVSPTPSLIYTGRLLTAGQAMAAKREDFGTVGRALAEFTPKMLDEALRILNADAVARSERFLAPVQWLRNLHNRPKGRAGENVLWRALAAAPDGYCHPRSGMAGSLLEDIANNLPFEDIKARWEAKMHPLRYQRPQAAPTAGNIKAAEAIVAKLGIAPSLERRFARLDECETLWLPKREMPAAIGAGVFGHLKAKDTDDGVRPVDLPTQTMTWAKFRATVMSAAEAMEFLAPSHGNFMAFLTAANLEAPPILKWDHEDARNPVSLYVYHGGSDAAMWRVAKGWCKVTGISVRPNMWGAHPLPHLGDGALIILDGAVDTRTGQGNALFPETLRDDLHAVRSTIESYSKTATISGVEEGSACGYGISNGSIGITLRVKAAGAWSAYRIDRWD